MSLAHPADTSPDLQRDIEKEYAKYLKLTLRPPQGDSSAKAAALVPKIMGNYAEVHRLCDEKCALSQRLVDLLDSKRRHLDADLALVRKLAGEEPEPLPALGVAVKREPDVGLSGVNAAQQISDSIRSAMAGTPVADAGLPPVEAVASSGSHKRELRLLARDWWRFPRGVADVSSRAQDGDEGGAQALCVACRECDAAATAFEGAQVAARAGD